MKYVPNSPCVTRPKGMLSRRILISFPSSTIVVRALCAELGLTESSNSMSDTFLRLGRQRIPSREIVQVFLHDDVAAPGERSVFLADEHGIDRRVAPRILRSVDEADEIAVVEVTKAVHFFCRRHRLSDARHDLRRQFEAQIHAVRANVKEQVARRGNRVAPSGTNLPERM